MILKKQTHEPPEAQCLETVGLDDLAKNRLTQTLNDALNDGLEIIVGVKYKDEHIGLRANRSGLQLSSRIRWRGLGVIAVTVVGYLASLIY